VKETIAREWTLRSPDEALVREIREATGLSPIVARILANRGIAKASEAERFLSGSLGGIASPFLLKDLEKAARRLLAAGVRREPVLIYADYDADGATGAACLFLFLKEMFPDLPVRVHQNHRVRDGYGMKPRYLDEAAAAGVRLVITVDGGITDVEPIRHAASLGLSVIVTDHHVPGPVLPPAHAVLNPRQEGCAYPEKELAGAGVAFLLVCGLRRLIRDEGLAGAGALPNLRRYLDLVALGTVADMVPLRGDNRLFVKAGIEEIRRRPRPGIRALLAAAGIAPSAADETDLAFRVGPRLNAASRVGESRRGFDLLVTEDDGFALRLAQELNRDNARRQAEEERIYRGALAMIPDEVPASPFGSLVLAHPAWHPGILGIVASRIAERFFRPTVLLAVDGDVAQGSCRSAGGFPLIEAFAALSPLLSRYGGHRHAAGVALPVANLPAFREGLDGIARRFGRETAAAPRIAVDAEVDLSEVSFALMGEFDRLRPFGMGNEEPVLLARNLRMVRKSLFGSGEQHLRFEVAADGRSLPVVAFQRAGLPLGPGSALDLLFTPQRSSFRGIEQVRLLFRDARPGGSGGP
jgi:single-stranded-DNA-specific exonuclease